MITDTPNGRGKSQQANRAPAYGTYMDTSDGTKPSGLKKDTDSHSPQRRYISCCGTIYTLVLITPRAFWYHRISNKRYLYLFRIPSEPLPDTLVVASVLATLRYQTG